jgi:hypothetical protein
MMPPRYLPMNLVWQHVAFVVPLPGVDADFDAFEVGGLRLTRLTMADMSRLERVESLENLMMNMTRGSNNFVSPLFLVLPALDEKMRSCALARLRDLMFVMRLLTEGDLLDPDAFVTYRLESGQRENDSETMALRRTEYRAVVRYGDDGKARALHWTLADLGRFGRTVYRVPLALHIDVTGLVMIESLFEMWRLVDETLVRTDLVPGRVLFESSYDPALTEWGDAALPLLGAVEALARETSVAQLAEVRWARRSTRELLRDFKSRRNLWAHGATNPTTQDIRDLREVVRSFVAAAIYYGVFEWDGEVPEPKHLMKIILDAGCGGIKLARRVAVQAGLYQFSPAKLDRNTSVWQLGEARIQLNEWSKPKAPRRSRKKRT